MINENLIRLCIVHNIESCFYIFTDNVKELFFNVIYQRQLSQQMLF
jgi:hypothetical protein